MLLHSLSDGKAPEESVGSLSLARAAVRSFTSDDLASQEAVVSLIQSVAAATHSGQSEDVSLLLELLGRLDHRPLGLMTSQLFFCTSDHVRRAVTDLVEKQLAGLPARLLTAGLRDKIGSSSALRPRHVVPLLGPAFAYGMSDDDLHRLVAWFWDSEPVALTSFTYAVAGRSDQLMRALTDRHDLKTAAPRAVTAAARWLAADGALPAWRRAFCEPTSTASTRDSPRHSPNAAPSKPQTSSRQNCRF